MSQFQSCHYIEKSGSLPKYGIAKMQSGFGCCDVDFIISADGNKVEDIYDYSLCEGPLCYIQLPETRAMLDSSLNKGKKRK